MVIIMDLVSYSLCFSGKSFHYMLKRCYGDFCSISHRIISDICTRMSGMHSVQMNLKHVQWGRGQGSVQDTSLTTALVNHVFMELTLATLKFSNSLPIAKDTYIHICYK